VSDGPEGPAAATDDRLLGGRVHLKQPVSGYRAAIDPVLLAAAVTAAAGERVLDLGCGVGAAMLCLAVRVPGVFVTGLECQADLAALAADNIAANGLGQRARVVCGDVATLEGLAAERFDHVIMNPPFLAVGSGTRPPERGKGLSTTEGDADLALWVDAAHRALVPRGWLTLVHRADRVDSVFAALASRYGAVSLVPLWPKHGQPARRIIVRARKGVRSPAAVQPGLVLHTHDGTYTDGARRILEDAQALA
jgi:tRNA1(Val) A37 N6-methylase TrmN6